MNRNLPVRCLTAAAFGAAAVVFALTVGCPVARLFRFPCPACGVTRAWCALFGGQAALAFRYHPLFWLFPVILGLYPAGERLCARIGRRRWNGMLVGIALLCFAVYLVRIFLWKSGALPYFPA
ncbi:putative uncharacterized protein [Clostridium sp. CAG:448]|nr:putative uncharacterized protein [Clostridium sp. CAG:448]